MAEYVERMGNLFSRITTTLSRALSSKELWVILLAAVAIRLLLSSILDWRGVFSSGDSEYYLAGTIDGYRPPLYSLFVALVGPKLVLPVQAGLTIIGAGLAWIGLKDFDRRLAGMSAIALALSPLPVPIELRVLSETLYGFLVFGCALLLFRSKPVLAGVVMALAILTRDTLLLLPMFFLPFVQWRKGLAFVASAYLVAAPYYLTTPPSQRSGLALWIGTWEREPWGGVPFPAHAFTSERQKAQLEVAYGRGDYAPFKQAAIDRIKSDPAFVVQSWAVRYPRQWLSTRTELIGVTQFRLPVKLAGFAINLAVLFLGVAGMFLARRELRLFIAPIIYAAVSQIPFHNTEPRYFLFAFSFLTLLSVEALLAVREARLARRITRQRPSIPGVYRQS